MAELILDLFHVIDLVGAGIRTWPNRLVVLDPEVDSSDRVFAGKNTDLMGGFVLEAGCGGVENNHLVILLDQPLHLILELFLAVQQHLVLHDVEFCIGCENLHVVAVFGWWELLTSLEIARCRLRAKCQVDLGGPEHAEPHCVVFTADGAHVRHFCVSQ